MKKYLEFKDAAKNSSKFWQIEIESKKVTIQFGRIGIVNPAMLIKEFKSIEAETREEAMERVQAFTNINFITTDIIQAVIEVGKKNQNAFNKYPENTSFVN
jgi:predicted DNA-binding WGR domain protein